MGGKALKEVFTRRYEREEFDNLVEEILPKVRQAFGTEAELVISYKTKDSFGDMDILLKADDCISVVRETIQKTFNPGQIHHNGDCWSFDYKELQIDLILTSPTNWEIANVFFSYNDLGNLIGKLYHKFGLKFGFDGAKYAHNIENDEGKKRKLGTIYLSKNPRKIFEFVGLNWNRYLEGFDTIQDIFDYIIESKYFDPEIFKMENLNHIDKSRNKKRVNYQLFLDYIKGKDANTKWDLGEDKSKYHKYIHNYFLPEVNFNKEIKKLNAKERKRIEIAKKFNGRLIMDWYPEVTGPKLGGIINDFKHYIENIRHNLKGYVPMSFEGYLDFHSAERVEADFKNYMSKWGKKLISG